MVVILIHAFYAMGRARDVQYLGVSIWHVGLSPDKGLLSDRFKCAEGRQLKFLKRAGYYDIFYPLSRHQSVRLVRWSFRPSLATNRAPPSQQGTRPLSPEPPFSPLSYNARNLVSVNKLGCFR